MALLVFAYHIDELVFQISHPLHAHRTIAGLLEQWYVTPARTPLETDSHTTLTWRWHGAWRALVMSE
jgi:uncharacterized protein YcgI (DUF1989 family)